MAIGVGNNDNDDVTCDEVEDFNEVMEVDDKGTSLDPVIAKVGIESSSVEPVKEGRHRESPSVEPVEAMNLDCKRVFTGIL
jgi:hypothetical protein